MIDIVPQFPFSPCLCGETQGAEPFEMIRAVTANGLRLHLIYSEVAFGSGGATICLLVTSCCAPPVSWLPVRTYARFSYGRSASDLFVAW